MSNYEYAINFLKAHSKGQDFVSFQKAIIKTRLEIIGIPTADIKKFAKECFKKGDFNFGKPKFYELVLLEGLCIAQINDFADATKRFEQFFDKIDNWAVVDIVVGQAKAFKKDEQSFDWFKKLILSEKEFVCRFGLVGFLKHFTSQDDIERVLTALNNVKCDKYYVQMALSWIISEIIIKNPQNAENIMQKIIKNNHFNSFVINKAIQKVCESFRIDEQIKSIVKKYKVKD